MRHIDCAVQHILRELKLVEDDPLTPARLSPEISAYLVDLMVQYPNDHAEFSKFVLSLPRQAIVAELLRRMLPAKLRQAVLDYRAEHEALQIEKEYYIEDQSYDQAARCRAQQDLIAQSISELVRDQEITIAPQLVSSVLRSLGYKGP